MVEFNQFRGIISMLPIADCRLPTAAIIGNCAGLTNSTSNRTDRLTVLEVNWQNAITQMLDAKMAPSEPIQSDPFRSIPFRSILIQCNPFKNSIFQPPTSAMQITLILSICTTNTYSRRGSISNSMRKLIYIYIYKSVVIPVRILVEL